MKRHVFASRSWVLADALFYKIYSSNKQIWLLCRATCTCRNKKKLLERLSNIEVISDPNSAVGCVPCRKCKPLDPEYLPPGKFVWAIAAQMWNDPAKKYSLRQLSKKTKRAECHLQRTFKAIVGKSPKQFHEFAKDHAAGLRGISLPSPVQKDDGVSISGSDWALEFKDLFDEVTSDLTTDESSDLMGPFGSLEGKTPSEDYLIPDGELYDIGMQIGASMDASNFFSEILTPVTSPTG